MATQRVAAAAEEPDERPAIFKAFLQVKSNLPATRIARPGARRSRASFGCWKCWTLMLHLGLMQRS